jgi:hypothetical protein
VSDVSPSMVEIGFLRRLEAGVDYADAVNACGHEGLRVAFNCTLNGWVDRGRITSVGTALIRPTVICLGPGTPT